MSRRHDRSAHPTVRAEHDPPVDPDLLGRRNHRLLDTRQRPPCPAYRFVDLFCGCGGITCGFLMAGLRPVLAVELTRPPGPGDLTHAQMSYRRNFPQVWMHDRGVETLGGAMLRSGLGDETPHVLVGGPPCQAYSRSGKRDPHDPRARLYVEYLRLVSELRPDVVVMENVREIRSAGGGEFVEDIVCGLEALGYADPSMVVLDSARFGVPQRRLRAILIANRHGMPNLYPNGLLEEPEFITVRLAIRDLADLPRDPDWNHDWPVHARRVVEGLAHLAYGESLHGYSEAWEKLHPDRPAPTVKANNGGAIVNPWVPRVLSVREMARLQSFPDRFDFRGGVTAERKQVGNALPPEMAKHVAIAVAAMLDAAGVA